MLDHILDYDKKFDILYILFADTSNSYVDDTKPGIMYIQDADTDELTGISIVHFSKTMQDMGLQITTIL